MNKLFFLFSCFFAQLFCSEFIHHPIYDQKIGCLKNEAIKELNLKLNYLKLKKSKSNFKSDPEKRAAYNLLNIYFQKTIQQIIDLITNNKFENALICLKKLHARNQDKFKIVKDTLNNLIQLSIVSKTPYIELPFLFKKI